jgi:hypothetical protein
MNNGKKKKRKMQKIICSNKYEVKYALSLFNVEKIKNNSSNLIYEQILDMANQHGFPIVITEGLEHYLCDVYDAEGKINVHGFIREKYGTNTFIFNTRKEMLLALDGRIYGIIDISGKVVCDVMEDDYIYLLDNGYIDDDNIANDDVIKYVLERKVNIIILEEHCLFQPIANR